MNFRCSSGDDYGCCGSCSSFASPAVGAEAVGVAGFAAPAGGWVNLGHGGEGRSPWVTF